MPESHKGSALQVFFKTQLGVPTTATEGVFITPGIQNFQGDREPKKRHWNGKNYYGTQWYDFTGWIDASGLIDVCLIFGLSFGIYKKSRVAAVIMLVYFSLSQAWIVIVLKRFPGIISWIFLILFLRGVPGTFTYQKLSKS